jgi:hypothetical protein
MKTTVTHEYLLEEYFFKYLDRGISASNTPLFLHNQGSKDLISELIAKYQIHRNEAEIMIRNAFEEVRLN